MPTSTGEPAEPLEIRPAVPPAASGWRRRRGADLAATAIDEALLSAISLATALALIHGASVEEYGLYSLVLGVLMLLRGGQNALVLTPLATAGGRLRGDERGAFVRALGGLQIWFGAALALVFAAGVWLFVPADGAPLALGAGVGLLGAWLREYRRAVALLDGRNGAALGGDVLFGVLAAAAIAALWLGRGQLTAGGVLSASGAAAAVAAFIGFRAGSRESGAIADRRQVARTALDQGRWSVPGMMVAWGQNSGYVYAVGIALGAGAVGEIAAARLFLVPLLLCGVAWNRVFLPRAAALLADGGGAVLVTRCARALRLVLLGSALYLSALVVAWALGLARLLPPAYAGCEPLILGWGGYAAVNLARSIATTALTARLEFRRMFAIASLSAAVTLALVVALTGPLGGLGALAGIIGGELLLALLSWRALLAAREP